MKKNALLLCLLIVIASPIKLFSLSCFFESFDSRHAAIKNKVIESISTKNTPWKQISYGYSVPPLTRFKFIPEKDVGAKTYEESFTYSEFDFSKEKEKYNDIDTFNSAYGKKETKYQTKRIVSKSDKEEFGEYNSTGMDTSYFKTVLAKTIKTGEFRFVFYEYGTEKKLSQEEKNYWFDVFNYFAFEKGNLEISKKKYIADTVKKTATGNW